MCLWYEVYLLLYIFAVVCVFYKLCMCILHVYCASAYLFYGLLIMMTLRDTVFDGNLDIILLYLSSRSNARGSTAETLYI